MMIIHMYVFSIISVVLINTYESCISTGHYNGTKHVFHVAFNFSNYATIIDAHNLLAQKSSDYKPRLFSESLLAPDLSDSESSEKIAFDI